MDENEIIEQKETQLEDIEVCKKLVQLHQSATNRGLPFNLTFKTVKRLMTVDRCYYTGIEFEDEGLLSRSIDRVDSAKGYEEGNVVACTVDINGKKANLTFSEIEKLYTQIKKFVSFNREPNDEVHKKHPKRKSTRST